MFKISAVSVDTGRQTTPIHSSMAWYTTDWSSNDTFITSLATFSLSNKEVNACPVFLHFSHFGSAKIIEIG